MTTCEVVPWGGSASFRAAAVRLAVWIVLIAVVAIATAGALGVVLVRGMSERRARCAEFKAPALCLAARAAAS